MNGTGAHDVRKIDNGNGEYKLHADWKLLLNYYRNLDKLSGSVEEDWNRLIIQITSLCDEYHTDYDIRKGFHGQCCVKIDGHGVRQLENSLHRTLEAYK